MGLRAYDILLTLIEARERVVTKGELLDRVWPLQDVEENNLSTQVSKLRRLVGYDAIATVSGRGYRFAVAVRCLDTEGPYRANPADRPSEAEAERRRLSFGALEWLPAERIAIVRGHRAELGSRGIDLLALLIAERHRVLSKSELLASVWPGTVVEENNLQVQVSGLRKLLGQDAIATVPGRGYRFTMPAQFDEPTVRDASIGEEGRTREVRTRTNLPHAMEELLGRDEELEQLEQLLKAQRLLTLLGPGGIGKTRVAQVLARTQVDRFSHGVWWVDLGALSYPNEVAPAIAVAARVQLGPGDAALQIALALESRHTLIVLDNCEHLVGEVSRIVRALLEVASQAKVLATSQERLRLQGEQVFRLGGLNFPSNGTHLEEARGYGAVMLLERRAQAASSRFALTEKTVAIAIDLCRQLDGIPLAIEMAAAMLPHLGANALHTALGERLHWLRNSLRDAPARQRTLRATIDWSCSLLGAREQVVLRRLAVFAGSFGLGAAKHVACSSEVDGWTVVESLSTLVERSLVQVDCEDRPRYRLLETMRIYANEQLQAHGEKVQTQIAHMQLMASVGNEAEAKYWTTPDGPWLDRFEQEYDDLQAAFLYACSAEDAEAGAATLDALYRIDELRLSPIATRSRLPAASALLAHADGGSELRIRLVLGSLLLAHVPVAGLSKLEMVQPASELARALEDTPRLYQALMSVVLHATVAGYEEIALSALKEADSLERPAWSARLRWYGAVHRTFYHTLRGDSTASMASVLDQLSFAEKAQSAIQTCAARAGVADVALMRGDTSEAIRLGTSFVAEARLQGWDAYLGSGLTNLCNAFVVAGELGRAAEVAAEAIELMWRHEKPGYLLDTLSLLAAKKGRFKDSLFLVGSADTWYADAQYAREGNEAAAVGSAMALNVAALGAVACAHGREAGSLLTLSSAKQLALSSVRA